MLDGQLRHYVPRRGPFGQRVQVNGVPFVPLLDQVIKDRGPNVGQPCGRRENVEVVSDFYPADDTHQAYWRALTLRARLTGAVCFEGWEELLSNKKGSHAKQSSLFGPDDQQ